jgi:hypothetical protein
MAARRAGLDALGRGRRGGQVGHGGEIMTYLIGLIEIIGNLIA